MVWGKELQFSPFESIILLLLLMSLFPPFFYNRVMLGCNDTDVNLNKMSNQNKVSVTVELIYRVLWRRPW